MPWLELGVLAAAGFGAGYLNTAAGAGSLLTLPALIFTGLDATSANATNRVAVLVQNAVALATFHHGGLGTGAVGWVLSVPAAAAGLGGALLASRLPEPIMRGAMGLTMLAFVVLLPLVRRRLGARAGTDVRSLPRPTTGLVAVFAALGFFAGFVQVGVGVLLLLVLAGLRGADLVTANHIKVVVILVTTAGALVVFAWQAAGIDPLRGAVLGVANGGGAWLAARSTLKRGERVVYYALLVAAAASGAKLVWDVVLRSAA